MPRDAKRSNVKQLLGLLVAVLIGGVLLAVLLVSGRLWWVALRGTDASSPTQAATEGGTASIRIAWDKSPAENVTGYRILFGTERGKHTNSVSVGNEASATLTNLKSGTRYYIVTVAVDADGNQSPPSNEIEAIAAD